MIVRGSPKQKVFLQHKRCLRGCEFLIAQATELRNPGWQKIRRRSDLSRHALLHFKVRSRRPGLVEDRLFALYLIEGSEIPGWTNRLV